MQTAPIASVPMQPPHPRKYRFPWRRGNRFELLVDGPAYFPAMLEAIASARRQVLLEMYLMTSGAVAGRFVEALATAAVRGVEVRMLLDDIGARGLGRADRERLVAAGVQIAFYNPLRLEKLFNNLVRNHRKLLVVDSSVAFVGGTGLSDEFEPAGAPDAGWRETMVRIEGPVIADWRALFERGWRRAGSGDREREREMQSVAAPSTRTGDMAGRVTISRGPVREEFKRSLIRRARAARGRVWIATAYFTPSWRVRRTLRYAARRGVDVRVLLPGPDTDHPGVRHAGRRLYGALLRSGVRILEYQPRMLHMKVALCDDWSSIGSTNLDRFSLRWNLEANQEIDDPTFAASVEAMLAKDFLHAAECRYEDWRRRPWHLRLAERFWGQVDLWLTRLSRGRRPEP